jgi:PTH2 family peptidyl-tRNA hydrolase
MAVGRTQTGPTAGARADVGGRGRLLAVSVVDDDPHPDQPDPDQPHPDQPHPDAVKQVIVIRRDLKMRRGKEIAQGAHASSAWIASMVAEAIDPASRAATVTLDAAAFVWITSSWRKVALQVQTEDELVALHEHAQSVGLRSHLIRDGGHTEFHGVPTLTALAIGPDVSTEIDVVTGHLTLY